VLSNSRIAAPCTALQCAKFVFIYQ